MKSEKLKIEKYNRRDPSINIVELHQSIFKETEFEDNLIYFDPNFGSYLERLFDCPDHYFYVIKNEGFIEGFIHVRFISDFLILNNIAVSNAYANQGLGKKLLMFALNDLLKYYTADTVFKLDVFKSNNLAMNWYKRLGFEFEVETKWFELMNLPPLDNQSAKITERRDENNFLSLYCENEKIATIINGNLVLHRSNMINKVDLTTYKKIITNDVGFEDVLSTDQLKNSTQLIDISVRMRTGILSLIKKLN